MLEQCLTFLPSLRSLAVCKQFESALRKRRSRDNERRSRNEPRRETTEARSKRRSIHAPNLTDKLSTAEERRLNQFGSAGQVWWGKKL